MSVIIETNELPGPASYATGGFVVNTLLATVNDFKLFVETPGANLAHCHFEYVRNSPSAGQVTVKIVRHRSEKLTSIDSVTGLPSGVTAATSASNYDAEAAHTHNMDHNHAAVTSGNNTQTGGGAVIDLVGAQAVGTHTHQFDVPNFTGNTGASGSHTHAFTNLYEHAHSNGNTDTSANLSEVANTTDLSGTTFFYRAIE